MAKHGKHPRLEFGFDAGTEEAIITALVSGGKDEAIALMLGAFCKNQCKEWKGENHSGMYVSDDRTKLIINFDTEREDPRLSTTVDMEDLLIGLFTDRDCSLFETNAELNASKALAIKFLEKMVAKIKACPPLKK